MTISFQQYIMASNTCNMSFPVILISGFDIKKNCNPWDRMYFTDMLPCRILSTEAGYVFECINCAFICIADGGGGGQNHLSDKTWYVCFIIAWHVWYIMFAIVWIIELYNWSSFVLWQMKFFGETQTCFSNFLGVGSELNLLFSGLSSTTAVIWVKSLCNWS